jgi:hypothetical protein
MWPFKKKRPENCGACEHHKYVNPDNWAELFTFKKLARRLEKEGFDGEIPMHRGQPTCELIHTSHSISTGEIRLIYADNQPNMRYAWCPYKRMKK